jgi:translation initiation factor 4E
VRGESSKQDSNEKKKNQEVCYKD